MYALCVCVCACVRKLPIVCVFVCKFALFLWFIFELSIICNYVLLFRFTTTGEKALTFEIFK